MSSLNTPFNKAPNPTPISNIRFQTSCSYHDTYLEPFAIAYLLISAPFPKSLDAKSVSWWLERGSSKVLAEVSARCPPELRKVQVKRQMMLSRFVLSKGTCDLATVLLPASFSAGY